MLAICPGYLPRAPVEDVRRSSLIAFPLITFIPLRASRDDPVPKQGKDKTGPGSVGSQGSTVTPSTIAYGSRHMLPGPAVVSAQSQTESHFVDFPEMQAFSRW
jgi:hypothetical protein